VLDDSYKQRVKNLCDLIAKEQDQKRFSVLIHELNQLLDGVQASSPKRECWPTRHYAFQPRASLIVFLRLGSKSFLFLA